MARRAHAGRMALRRCHVAALLLLALAPTAAATPPWDEVNDVLWGIGQGVEAGEAIADGYAAYVAECGPGAFVPEEVFPGEAPVFDEVDDVAWGLHATVCAGGVIAGGYYGAVRPLLP